MLLLIKAKEYDKVEDCLKDSELSKEQFVRALSKRVFITKNEGREFVTIQAPDGISDYDIAILEKVTHQDISHIRKGALKKVKKLMKRSTLKKGEI